MFFRNSFCENIHAELSRMPILAYMLTFLEEVVAHIDENQLSSLHTQAYIFPTRRACTYFVRYLKSRFKSIPFLLPEILTIQEFIYRYSSYTIAEELNLLLDLHEIHQRIAEYNQPLEKFLPWGKLILKDFDECDKYLVDTQKLFSLLNEQKSLEDFSFLDEELRTYIEQFLLTTLTIKNQEETYKQHFIKTWRLLGEIYTHFQQKLNNEKKAYEGMMYKDVLQQLESSKLILSYSQITFVGFNALTLSEEKIFKTIAKSYTANFYWDVADDFMENKHHEAGIFMRLNKHVFHTKNNHWINQQAIQKEVTICGIASDVGQAQYAVSLLCEDKHKQVALVLCDEQLLHPLLYHVEADQCNITMGYPARYHEVFAFTTQLIQFYSRARLREQQTDFYYRDVLGLMQSVFLRPKIRDLEKLQATASYFVPYFPENYIRDFFPDFLFIREYSFTAILHQVIAIIQSSEFDDAYFIPVREAIIESLSSFVDLIARKQLELSREILPQLYRQYFSGIKIPFETKTESRVQIMGFLETRLMDFDEVIILSANDDKLPGSHKNNSFIPYNLRKGFGLPTYEQADGIGAYHFYRLLKRAEKITLLYNNKSGEDSSEKSRFIRQIEHEWTSKAGTLKHKVILPETKTDLPPEQEQPIEIKKTDAMKVQLAERVYSPTALKLYIKCPLQFYLRYVEKIKEPEQSDDDFDDGTFGLILHKTLELIYKPYIGKTISEENIIAFSSDSFIRKKIKEACESEDLKLPKEILSSRHQLQFKVIETYVKRILVNDAKEKKLQVLHTEQKFKWENLPLENGTFVVLEGIFDRVDKMDENTIRIIDYKTGVIHLPDFPNEDEQPDKFLESLFTFTDKNHDYSAAFQGLLYALMYYKLFNCTHIIVAYHHTRTITSGLSYLNEGKPIPVDLLLSFEKRLSDLLSEIIYKQDSFIQSENKNAYDYSPYADMLGVN